MYSQSKRGLTPEGEGTTLGAFTLGVKDPSIKCPNTKLFIKDWNLFPTKILHLS
jgi:hypothetical protein